MRCTWYSFIPIGHKGMWTCAIVTFIGTMSISLASIILEIMCKHHQNMLSRCAYTICHNIGLMDNQWCVNSNWILMRYFVPNYLWYEPFTTSNDSHVIITQISGSKIYNIFIFLCTNIMYIIFGKMYIVQIMRKLISK